MFMLSQWFPTASLLKNIKQVRVGTSTEQIAPRDSVKPPNRPASRDGDSASERRTLANN